MSDPKIIVALDYDNDSDAIRLVKRLDPQLCRLKIGKELFTTSGPDIIKQVQDYGFDVFLDLKFHDIPVTVAKACTAAANLGVWMLNVHALGGPNMLDAARKAIDDASNTPHLIAVTILTSMNQQQLDAIGIQAELNNYVNRLATLAKKHRMDGVVCSAREASSLANALGKDFMLVTPGIRPSGSGRDDQERTMTPSEAVNNGSHYLVIGRPITQAIDPIRELKAIHTELGV